MEAYITEWLSLLLRWTHLIVGIAWIGSSFYFVWLDTNLATPATDPEDDRVHGDLWSIHGGGFYHAQKYLAGPARLPDHLHWFKWEAYTTWLTGFALLIVTYYLKADAYLVDRSVLPMSASTAVTASLVLLLVGWLVYDMLCRSGLSDRMIALIGSFLLIALSFGLAQLFSGRGAYIQMGAMLGTIMAANVLMVIIPGQRKMVDAISRGEEPDPEPGKHGKQRSVHNNYITLPVLFVMLSSHYPMTFSHRYNWLILIALFAIGAVVRHYFNLRNAGRHVPALPIAAALAVVALAAAIAPKTVPLEVQETADSNKTSITTAAILPVIAQRCANCHSANPNHPTAPIAPKGIMLETTAQIDQWAQQVHDFTVINRTMPLGNLTEMTEAERQLIARWFAAR